MGKTHEVDLEHIKAHIITTWQPVSAIAHHADIPIKTALKGCLQLEQMGQVKKARARIDGHNEVHLFRRLEFTKVFNILVPIDTNGMEL